VFIFKPVEELAGEGDHAVHEVGLDEGAADGAIQCIGAMMNQSAPGGERVLSRSRCWAARCLTTPVTRPSGFSHRQLEAASIVGLQIFRPPGYG